MLSQVFQDLTQPDIELFSVFAMPVILQNTLGRWHSSVDCLFSCNGCRISCATDLKFFYTKNLLCSSELQHSVLNC